MSRSKTESILSFRKMVMATALVFLLPIASNAQPTTKEAIHLLNQASFGPSPQSISNVKELGIEGWVNKQLSLPRSQSQLSRTVQIALNFEPSYNWFRTGRFNPGSYNVQNYQLATWWEQALTADDQLRQRVAFALSQIMVVSNTERPLDQRAEGFANYNDILLGHAFGNFRNLLFDISMSPVMGIFLSHQGNKKSDPTQNISPDENFARELMQLFSVGLYQVNSDGSPILDASGRKIPTYTQEDVMELAKVFTGWDLVGNTRYGESRATEVNILKPLEFTPEFHDRSDKKVLGEKIKGYAQGIHEVNQAIDILFNNPSLPPYISKLLIQRLVKSNPSPEYIKRVSTSFEHNADGVRGDMKTVIKSIILDPEAREIPTRSKINKIKEPVLALSGFLRRFDVSAAPEWTNQYGVIQRNLVWIKTLPIGQNPFRASSVFNFYLPDFQPTSSDFTKNDWVSPESSVLNTTSLTGFNNTVLRIFQVMDTRTNPERALKTVATYHKINVQIDTSPWVENLENSLKDDISKSPNKKEDNILRFIQKIEEYLLSFPLSPEAEGKLVSYLAERSSLNMSPDNLRNLIHEIISTLVLTPEYWTE